MSGFDYYTARLKHALRTWRQRSRGSKLSRRFKKDRESSRHDKRAAKDAERNERGEP